MKGLAMFAIISAALIAVCALLLSLAFDGPGEMRAIRVSAAVAWPVQMLTFAVARLGGRDKLIVGWGIGALIRFATLAVYGLVIVRALELPATPALISLATFFFVTMVVEPVLLTK